MFPCSVNVENNKESVGTQAPDLYLRPTEQGFMSLHHRQPATQSPSDSMVKRSIQHFSLLSLLLSSFRPSHTVPYVLLSHLSNESGIRVIFFWSGCHSRTQWLLNTLQWRNVSVCRNSPEGSGPYWHSAAVQAVSKIRREIILHTRVHLLVGV